MLALFAAALITCTSPGITDGDTIRCNGERVRLWGVNAPEAATPDGPAATRALAALTRGRKVECWLPPSGQERDRYGRAVRQCFAGPLDLGGEMIRQGHAHELRRFSAGYYSR